MQQNAPEIQLVDEARIHFDTGNLRPLASIHPQRVIELAASIRETQGRGAGYWGTGVETPVTVYSNGRGDFYLPNGQGRVLAIRRLRATDPTYKYLGIPAEIRQAPNNVWESTAMQMALHDVTQINILDLVRRAVSLRNSGLPNGKPASWTDVCAVMGKSPAEWSHYQHMLRLIEPLQQAVIDGKMRAETASVIGRDLGDRPDLQEQHAEQLIIYARKPKQVLGAFIVRILQQDALGDLGDDIDGDYDDLDFEDDDDLPLPPPSRDQEAQYHINQVYKHLTRLEVMAGEGRITGMGDDLAQIAERFSDLEGYA